MVIICPRFQRSPLQATLLRKLTTTPNLRLPGILTVQRSFPLLRTGILSTKLLRGTSARGDEPESEGSRLRIKNNYRRPRKKRKT
jgi:hypothetical protein